jgi:serine/threonine-protein kinase
MAEVFEAQHVDLGKRVAVKVVPLPVGADDNAVRRVLREGRLATAVHHPNVVAFFDVGVQDRTPYLVMELLEGEDLAQRLKRAGSLSPQQAVDLMLPVLSGMSAAHAAGVVHRDLKPSNIFLARRHRGVDPVVVDFGISRSVRRAAAVPASSSRVIAGTVQYMAPEQVRGSRDITPQSDQYALGVILYECVTGGTPFWGEDHYELLHAIMTAPLVPPSELSPRVPRRFDAVVLRALARDPGARYASLHALGAALLPLASDEVRRKWSEEFAPFAAQEAERPNGPWRPYAAIGAAVAALTVATLVVRIPVPKPPTSEPPSLAASVAASVAATGVEPTAPPPVPSVDAAPTVAPHARARPFVTAPSRPKVPVTLSGGAPAPPAVTSAPQPVATVERGTANIPIVE